VHAPPGIIFTLLVLRSGLFSGQLRELLDNQGGDVLAPGYGLAIIMAGTNDIGISDDAAAAVPAHVEAMHRHCWARGVPTVAITIPESRPATLISTITQRRMRANAGIVAALTGAASPCADDTSEISSAAAVSSGPAGASPAGASPAGASPAPHPEVSTEVPTEVPTERFMERCVALVDSTGLLPFAEGSGLWDPDGLHLSAEGYRALGERLAERLVHVVAARLAARAEQVDAAGGMTSGASGLVLEKRKKEEPPLARSGDP